MPIKGFPERKRMRRVGIVRLGIKLISEKTGREYPRATDYFVLTDAPGLAEIYGDKPRVLNILMVSDDPNIAFPYYMMRYRRRGLMCMGDGERILRRRDEDGAWEVIGGTNVNTGEIEPCRSLECPYGMRPENGRADCQPTGRLRFICADNPTHGYYQLTVRKRAIEGFLGQLDFAKAILGRITGYPWQLILEQEMVQLQSGQRKLWIPQLEIEPRIFQDRLKRLHAGEALALPEGIREPTPEMERELTEDLDYEPTEPESEDPEQEEELTQELPSAQPKPEEPDLDAILEGEDFERAMRWLRKKGFQYAVSPPVLNQFIDVFEIEPPSRRQLNELVQDWRAAAPPPEANQAQIPF